MEPATSAELGYCAFPVWNRRGVSPAALGLRKLLIGVSPRLAAVPASSVMFGSRIRLRPICAASCAASCARWYGTNSGTGTCI